MSAWRGIALDLFPGLKQSLLVSDDYWETWLELHHRFRKAIADGNHDFAKRFFRYAVWHLARRSHQAHKMSKAGQAAAELLYEFMDELENWIDRYDFMQAHYGLKYFLHETRYAGLSQVLLSARPDTSGIEGLTDAPELTRVVCTRFSRGMKIKP